MEYSCFFLDYVKVIHNKSAKFFKSVFLHAIFVTRIKHDNSYKIYQHINPHFMQNKASIDASPPNQSECVVS